MTLQIDDCVDAAENAEATAGEPDGVKERPWARILVYVVLPLLVLAAACGVGFLKLRTDPAASPTNGAVAEAVVAATEGAAKMLSYRSGHVQEDLTAASERMTGGFRDEFTTLITEVVIPGAEEKQISAVATVPAAALVSTDGDRAQVLVYIDQTTTVGAEPPTETRSSARVEMAKVGSSWLIAGFEPI